MRSTAAIRRSEWTLASPWWSMGRRTRSLEIDMRCARWLEKAHWRSRTHRNRRYLIARTLGASGLTDRDCVEVLLLERARVVASLIAASIPHLRTRSARDRRGRGGTVGDVSSVFSRSVTPLGKGS